MTELSGQVYATHWWQSAPLQAALKPFITVLIVSLTAAVPPTASSEPLTYPTRPIRIIVPSSPSGGLDLLARTLGRHMTASWGQSVVVDNRAGAGGTIGADLVAKSAPDGYTLLIVSSSFAVNPSVYPKLPYDSVKDFAPIILATTQPQVLVVHFFVPVHSVGEFVVLAKAKPGQLNYCSVGVGTLGQLAFELFKTAARIDVVHIPYKGAGLSMGAIVAGEVQASMASSISVAAHVRSGRLRALATPGLRRPAAFSDVPTVSEEGLPDATITGWYALLTTSSVPRATIDKLNAELARILTLPQTREQLERDGSEPALGTPDQLGKHIATEITRLKRVIVASGGAKG